MVKLIQHIVIGLLIFLLLINFSCKKEEDPPEVTNKIEIGTTNIDTISYYTSTISTILTSTGGHQITQHGHCWSIDKEPTIEDNHTKLGSKNDAGTFTSELDSLEPATEYYVRAYTAYALGTVYGGIKEFNTINTGSPVVKTSDVQDVTPCTANCGGVVENDSGLVITACGVCWNTTGSPTLEDCIAFTTDSVGSGIFTSQVTNLEEGTTYFINAYATNEKGISYGDVKSFNTVPIVLPSINTGLIYNITTSSALCNSAVIDEGNGTVSARGICWGTSENFDLASCLGFSVNGAGLGEFTGNITELQDGTTYYVTAYATNEKGTAYGEVKSFETIAIGLPVLTTLEVINITTSSAQCGGNITDAGNGSIISRGVCWSTANDPTLDDCIGFTTDGSGTGSFTSNVTELTDGIQYYVRAYAANEEGTGYGETKVFTTIEIVVPTVTTHNVTNIAYTTAECGGNVTSAGNGTVTARGVCWSTSNNPSLENCLGFTTDGDGLGSYNSSITNLNSGENYYVRAYATNEKGTGYGAERNFYTILVLPVVITLEATNITTHSAESGGNVTSAGNGSVTTRGVCWGTASNPTLENCIGFTNEGGGMGSYSSSITELTDGTDYYVVAYATNNEGTGYGLVKQFTTIEITVPTVETAEVTEITTNSAVSGGNVANNGNASVTVRGVCWNTEGNPTLENCINNTLDGAGTGNFVSNMSDLQDGTVYYVAAYATNIAGTGYGTIRQFTTLDISLPTVVTADVTDITTNSAICGGNVTDEGNASVTTKGVCWSTSSNPSLENCLGYTVDGSGLGNFVSNISDLQDGTSYYVIAYATNEEGTGYGALKQFTTIDITVPTVETANVTDITSNSAICGGNVVDDGNAFVTAKGVCWNTSSNPTLENCIDYTVDGIGLGSFISNISGLLDGTDYYVVAYATNEEGTDYGVIKSFTTLDETPCDGQSSILYSGQMYQITEIGYQCWMAENLNVGSMINGTQTPTNNSIIEKYCFSDDPQNCNYYGGLYSWNEMMEYSIQAGARGICPENWHIPTDDEWKILEGTVDSQYGVGDPIWDGQGWRGYDAGKMLKSISGWYAGGNGVDAFGFTALPGGFRSQNTIFYNLGEGGDFFTSSLSDYNSAYVRWLSYEFDNIFRAVSGSLLQACSVRCLKD